MEQSLTAVGFDLATPGVALVETQRPDRRPFTTVLAQNAWTALSAQDFDRLAAPYPVRWKARMAARRAVALVNFRRAERIVCLTHSMADLVRARTGTPVTVAQVPAPMDVWAADETATTRPSTEGTSVLVPGTITWYKRPELTLGVASRLGRDQDVPPKVFFAGRDDGTGAWQRVQEEARRLRVDVSAGSLSRAEMRSALRTSIATIVPSELESLSLTLPEALILSGRVIASRLTVHFEISEVVGREPEWLETWLPTSEPSSPGVRLTPERTRAAWRAAGTALRLQELAEEGSVR